MGTATIEMSPRRISDLVEAIQTGADVRLQMSFEILPVEFRHQQTPFEAYIFLAKYKGAIDGNAFAFRKCYARGCPNNLCTHVSIAVQIANRYLQRDYHTLTAAGIEVAQTLFSLDDMVVKFEQLKSDSPQALTLMDLVGMARSGTAISMDIALETLPAVEHFAHKENAQTFLSGEFKARTAEGATYACHRCFACYATDQATREKPIALKVANARLDILYTQFEQSGITFTPRFFA